MHYLIDGHNLIAKLPDISLEDPYDEAKLVLQLRSWIAAGRNRRITVIFDGGLPGGAWRQLSSSRLKAIFASENNTADALLRKRVRQAKDAGAFTLVSSDREVLAAAKSRRMPFMSAEKFADGLAEFRQHKNKGRKSREKDGDSERKLSSEEIAEWLQMFESAAPTAAPHRDMATEIKPSEPIPSTDSKSLDKSTDLPAVEPAEIKSGTRKLNADEVSEWLEIFGSDDDQSS